MFCTLEVDSVVATPADQHHPLQPYDCVVGKGIDLVAMDVALGLGHMVADLANHAMFLQQRPAKACPD
jgi:hypothetical protein